MPLWRGLATMRDPHRDISFWVEIAGEQANKIWEFRRQDYIKSFSLKNVPTFLLDCRDVHGQGGLPHLSQCLPQV